MARTYFVAANTVKQPLTATVGKTALQLVAAANQRVAVEQFTVTFDSTVNTNTPVMVQIYRQTTAGTVVSSTASAKKKDIDISTSLNATVQDGFTVEPTYGEQEHIFFVHPQTGTIFPLPIPGEIILQGGGRLGVVITAPQGVNVLVALDCEE